LVVEDDAGTFLQSLSMKADTKKEKIMLSSEVQQAAGTTAVDADSLLYFAANDFSSFPRLPRHAVRYPRSAPQQFDEADAAFGVAACLNCYKAT